MERDILTWHPLLILSTSLGIIHTTLYPVVLEDGIDLITGSYRNNTDATTMAPVLDLCHKTQNEKKPKILAPLLWKEWMASKPYYQAL